MDDKKDSQCTFSKKINSTNCYHPSYPTVSVTRVSRLVGSGGEFPQLCVPLIRPVEDISALDRGSFEFVMENDKFTKSSWTLSPKQNVSLKSNELIYPQTQNSENQDLNNVLGSNSSFFNAVEMYQSKKSSNWKQTSSMSSNKASVTSNLQNKSFQKNISGKFGLFDCKRGLKPEHLYKQFNSAKNQQIKTLSPVLKKASSTGKTLSQISCSEAETVNMAQKLSQPYSAERCERLSRALGKKSRNRLCSSKHGSKHIENRQRFSSSTSRNDSSIKESKISESISIVSKEPSEICNISYVSKNNRSATYKDNSITTSQKSSQTLNSEYNILKSYAKKHSGKICSKSCVSKSPNPRFMGSGKQSLCYAKLPAERKASEFSTKTVEMAPYSSVNERTPAARVELNSSKLTSNRKSSSNANFSCKSSYQPLDNKVRKEKERYMCATDANNDLHYCNSPQHCQKLPHRCVTPNVRCCSQNVCDWSSPCHSVCDHSYHAASLLHCMCCEHTSTHCSARCIKPRCCHLTCCYEGAEVSRKRFLTPKFSRTTEPQVVLYPEKSLLEEKQDSINKEKENYSEKSLFEKKHLEEKLLKEKFLEEKLLEKKLLEEKILEEKILEEKLLKEKFLEERLLEKKLLEDKILEEKLFKEKFLEEKLLKEKLLEEKLLEEKFLEEKFLEEKLLEEKLREEKMLEEKLREKKLIEEQILEKKHLEEKLLEEKHLEEKHLEEKLLEEKLLEKKPLEENLPEKKYSEDHQMEEKHLENNHFGETHFGETHLGETHFGETNFGETHFGEKVLEEKNLKEKQIQEMFVLSRSDSNSERNSTKTVFAPNNMADEKTSSFSISSKSQNSSNKLENSSSNKRLTLSDKVLLSLSHKNSSEIVGDISTICMAPTPQNSCASSQNQFINECYNREEPQKIQISKNLSGNCSTVENLQIHEKKTTSSKQLKDSICKREKLKAVNKLIQDELYPKRDNERNGAKSFSCKSTYNSSSKLSLESSCQDEQSSSSKSNSHLYDHLMRRELSKNRSSLKYTKKCKQVSQGAHHKKKKHRSSRLIDEAELHFSPYYVLPPQYTKSPIISLPFYSAHLLPISDCCKQRRQQLSLYLEKNICPKCFCSKKSDESAKSSRNTAPLKCSNQTLHSSSILEVNNGSSKTASEKLLMPLGSADNTSFLGSKSLKTTKSTLEATSTQAFKSLSKSFTAETESRKLSRMASEKSLLRKKSSLLPEITEKKTSNLSNVFESSISDKEKESVVFQDSNLLNNFNDSLSINSRVDTFDKNKHSMTTAGSDKIVKDTPEALSPKFLPEISENSKSSAPTTKNMNESPLSRIMTYNSSGINVNNVNFSTKATASIASLLTPKKPQTDQYSDVSTFTVGVNNNANTNNGPDVKADVTPAAATEKNVKTLHDINQETFHLIENKVICKHCNQTIDNFKESRPAESVVQQNEVTMYKFSRNIVDQSKFNVIPFNWPQNIDAKRVPISLTPSIIKVSTTNNNLAAVKNASIVAPIDNVTAQTSTIMYSNQITNNTNIRVFQPSPLQIKHCPVQSKPPIYISKELPSNKVESDHIPGKRVSRIKSSHFIFTDKSKDMDISKKLFMHQDVYDKPYQPVDFIFSNAKTASRLPEQVFFENNTKYLPNTHFVNHTVQQTEPRLRSVTEPLSRSPNKPCQKFCDIIFRDCHWSKKSLNPRPKMNFLQ